MSHTPTPPPDTPDREPMSALIARSSLGARDAVRARGRVDVDRAQRIVNQAARRPAAIRPQNLGGRSGK